MTIETEPVADIDDLRREIDQLDGAILEAVKRRTEVSKLIGKARMASGGTRLVHSREMKVIDVGHGFRFDSHFRLLVVWGVWSHPVSGLTQETSPGSGSGPRGSGKQLDHGHRWPVPVEKSPLLDEHVNECATNRRGSAKIVVSQR